MFTYIYLPLLISMVCVCVSYWLFEEMMDYLINKYKKKRIEREVKRREQIENREAFVNSTWLQEQRPETTYVPLSRNAKDKIREAHDNI